MDEATKSFNKIPAENFDHARLVALKMAGYFVTPDVALATDEQGERIPLSSADRRYFSRIVRTRTNKDGTYRIKVLLR